MGGVVFEMGANGYGVNKAHVVGHYSHQAVIIVIWRGSFLAGFDHTERPQ